MTDSDTNKPLADVVEQNEQLNSDPDDSGEPTAPGRLPLEVDPADAAEQAREVSLDEDDYR
ncbi:MAG TPA: hypothetical protein VFI65_00520 [Streptosporangiaceae bacterium]|nr:hypothetical protein [Streptosporangiaceae bacterium]